MVSFEHKRLLELLEEADATPPDPSDYPQWFRGRRHLTLLRHDIQQDELILAALGPTNSCINSYVAPASHPALSNPLKGRESVSPNPYHNDAARYAWGWSLRGENQFPEAEPSTGGKWGNDLQGMTPLVYFRDIRGLTSHDLTPIEISQPFAHVTGIYWRQPESAYARIDHRGDWSAIVSVATAKQRPGTNLVSCRRQDLDLHLIATDAVLVRSFEFIMSRPAETFEIRYQEHVDRDIATGDGLYYVEQFNEGNFGAIRGVQIILPRLTPNEVEQLVKKGRVADSYESTPVDYKVLDFRNGEIATVSTDLSTTTNYFEAEDNDLPFETSPGFFRPEVLAKYKADTERYTVHENGIVCRGGWDLKSFGVNDAGQIFAYICDLRHLPHEEQLHWAIYNEVPRAGISERAITTDFKGEWPTEMTSREKLVDVLQRWQRQKSGWWKWRPMAAPHFRIVVPRTGSRDEWEAAIGRLCTDVIEGFDVKALRRILEAHEDKVDKNMRSIALLERILCARGELASDQRLVALRELNAGRNLGPAHAGQMDAREFVNEALEKHETFAAHFEHLCEKLAEELSLIERTLAKVAKD